MAEVWLREWRPEDASVIVPMLTDSRLLKWSSMNEVGVDRWIAEQQAGVRGPSLAICETGDDGPLGKIPLRMPGRASPATTCAAIRASDRPVGELSYWVLPAARGRGVARAAVGVMLDRARRTGKVRSVVLDIEVDNTASLSSLAPIGDSPNGPRSTVRVSRGRWSCSCSRSTRRAAPGSASAVGPAWGSRQHGHALTIPRAG